MRRTGAVAAVIAVVLLARCGEADRPAILATRPTVRLEAVALPVSVAPPAPQVAFQTPPVLEEPRPRQPPRLETVRGLMHGLGTPGCGCPKLLPGEDRHQITEFRKLGEGALDDCAFILADPNSELEEIVGVCEIICTLKTGRRFVPLLVQRLAADDAMMPNVLCDLPRKWVRSFVMSALEDLGDERDAWVLVRVLNRDEESRPSAAQALTYIGGPRELEALNAWLALQNPTDRILPRIRKSRDELDRRLRERQPPKPF